MIHFTAVNLVRMREWVFLFPHKLSQFKYAQFFLIFQAEEPFCTLQLFFFSLIYRDNSEYFRRDGSTSLRNTSNPIASKSDFWRIVILRVRWSIRPAVSPSQLTKVYLFIFFPYLSIVQTLTTTRIYVCAE